MRSILLKTWNGISATAGAAVALILFIGFGLLAFLLVMGSISALSWILEFLSSR